MFAYLNEAETSLIPLYVCLSVRLSICNGRGRVVFAFH